MTAADTTSRLPALDWDDAGTAKADLSAGGEALLSSLLVEAMREHAARLAGEAQATLVSVGLDFTGASFAPGTAEIRTDVDRQTRSLIFTNAELAMAGTLLIKATGIFRIA